MFAKGCSNLLNTAGTNTKVYLKQIPLLFEEEIVNTSRFRDGIKYRTVKLP